jgi:hypothetical protein
MKMRDHTAKKRATRHVARHATRSDGANLPRMYLFLELFVDKDIPQRSTK